VDVKAMITAERNATRKDDKSNVVVPVLDARSAGGASKKKMRKEEQQPPEKVFSHFLVHIPKSGSSYAISALNALIWPSPEYHALVARNQQFRGCNQGAMPTSLFREKFAYQFKGNKCTLWMSEQPYTKKAEHNYIVTRSPRQHILSQYFHCKESKDHADRARFMPSLDEWLAAWQAAIGNTTKFKENSKFHCYEAINVQSYYLGVSSAQNASREDLKERFDVVGDNAQMGKTVCMIFIRYTGWVPKECDCSNANVTVSESNNVTMSTTGDATQRRRRHRRLAAATGYNFDHGVTHHGTTFQTTPRQDEMIAKLTELDELLYQYSRDVFAEQVQEVEEEFKIKVCDKFRK
jgi:hypothetical protein